jgi:hypothetical protein
MSTRFDGFSTTLGFSTSSPTTATATRSPGTGSIRVLRPRAARVHRGHGSPSRSHRFFGRFRSVQAVLDACTRHAFSATGATRRTSAFSSGTPMAGCARARLLPAHRGGDIFVQPGSGGPNRPRSGIRRRSKPRLAGGAGYRPSALLRWAGKPRACAVPDHPQAEDLKRRTSCELPLRLRHRVRRWSGRGAPLRSGVTLHALPVPRRGRAFLKARRGVS